MVVQSRAIETSIIVPCYNEEKTISKLLKALLQQTYPTESMEIVIADSQSTDNTRERISEFSQNHPEITIQVIDNKAGTIPAAVNRAVENASGEFIVRMDAHSEPNEDYIAHSINLLKSGKADNVGGAWEIAPGNNSCIAAAIARAAAHPIGAGDAKYRVSKKAGYVETVPFGAFRKDRFLEIGKFNEKMLANEDYEFNTRLQKSGGKIWFDPRIKTTYYARSNLKALCRQYWRYGYWKFQMLKDFPESIRWRQAIPPLFVFSVLALIIISMFNSLGWIWLGILFSTYLSSLIIASLIETIRFQKPCFMNMVFSFVCMHFCWGSGFLLSMIRGQKNN